MLGIFNDATAFKQNLDKWKSKLNDKIKENNWFHTSSMFTGSVLAGSLPNWCDTEPECKDKQ